MHQPRKQSFTSPRKAESIGRTNPPLSKRISIKLPRTPKKIPNWKAQRVLQPAALRCGRTYTVKILADPSWALYHSYSQVDLRLPPGLLASGILLNQEECLPYRPLLDRRETDLYTSVTAGRT